MPLLSDLRSDLGVLLQSLRDVGLPETVRRIPRYLRTKSQEGADGFDQRFGTETSRMVSTQELNGIGPHQEDAILYWPTRQVEFDQLLRAAGTVDYHDFTFIDLGCGKGRVLMMASTLPFQRIVGVDFSPELVAMARRNLELFRGARRCEAIEVICSDAAAFALPAGDLMLFLFNPFGPRVLEKVLENLMTSLEKHPRQVLLLYNNSVHGNLVAQAGLRLLAEGHGDKWPWQVYTNP